MTTTDFGCVKTPETGVRTQHKKLDCGPGTPFMRERDAARTNFASRRLDRSFSHSQDPSSTSDVVTWKSVGTILWGLCISLIFVVVQVITILVYVFRTQPGLNQENIGQLLESTASDGQAIAISIFASTLICVPLVLAAVKLKKHSRIREYLALKAVSLRTFAPWLGVLILFIAASDATSAILGRPIVPEFMRLTYSSADPVWMLWIAFVAAAPMFEEVFFRGFLYGGLSTSAIGPIGAIIVTSAVWAATHVQYGIYEITIIFLIGLILGGARMHCRSLLVPFALHSVANFAATLEVALLG